MNLDEEILEFENVKMEEEGEIDELRTKILIVKQK